MAHPYPRHVRFASTIQQIIAPELLGIIPNCLVTVTQVDVTPNLDQARIMYSVIGADPRIVQEKLEEMSGYLRHKLAKTMAAKRVPGLEFRQAVSGRPDLQCTDS